MRYEGKTLEEALEQAAAAVGRPADDRKYRIIDDKKSFWGSRKVVVELITNGTLKLAPAVPAPGRIEEPADEETISEVTRILREILVAAELRVEVIGRGELAFELQGRDLPHLLAPHGEGLGGLQTPGGRLAGK